jgi:hypothetical protein
VKIQGGKKRGLRAAHLFPLFTPPAHELQVAAAPPLLNLCISRLDRVIFRM